MNIGVLSEWMPVEHKNELPLSPKIVLYPPELESLKSVSYHVCAVNENKLLCKADIALNH